MFENTRIVLSIGFLLVSGTVGFYTFNKVNRIPRADEEFIIEETRTVLKRTFKYENSFDYPVSIQRLDLSPSLSNVLKVSGIGGEIIPFEAGKNELILYFNRPLKKNDVLEYIITAEVSEYTTAFYIQKVSTNAYVLRYSVRELSPGVKSKRFVFPKRSIFDRIDANIKNTKAENNVITASGKFKQPGMFNIEVGFRLPEGKSIKAVENKTYATNITVETEDGKTTTEVKINQSTSYDNGIHYKYRFEAGSVSDTPPSRLSNMTD